MKKNNFLLRNAILAMILLFVGLTVSAQSWNDMVRLRTTKYWTTKWMRRHPVLLSRFVMRA